jgi:purine-nucleoside phosphorylase
MAPDLVSALDEACGVVRSRRQAPPQVGVVLGSGLGGFADGLDELVKIPYDGIPHMPSSSVAGHAGNLCLGRLAGCEVACMQGRVHGYEGHSPSRVVFGVRLLARLGCRAVLLTNAAGGVARDFRAGDLMLIVDHLNLTGHNPLVGPNPDQLGPRFPDLTRAYDERLLEAARRAAVVEGLTIREGVYAAMLGPSYETPAEIGMLQQLGAHAVGMSTVWEVIALRHMGVAVGAMSLITNLAAGLSGTLLDHAEVQAVAGQSAVRFAGLLRRWIGIAAEEGSQ